MTEMRYILLSAHCVLSRKKIVSATTRVRCRVVGGGDVTRRWTLEWTQNITSVKMKKKPNTFAEQFRGSGAVISDTKVGVGTMA
jgi:hypothetical protein